MNETGFKIERKTGAGGTYSQIATVRPVVTYNDTGLATNTTYFYRVRATNAIGDSAYSNEASATTQLNAPAAPSGLTATQLRPLRSISPGQITPRMRPALRSSVKPERVAHTRRSPQ